ncbi:MAG: hypothetical protein WCE94_15370 [Candidatus Methanoperedens sp.]|jgi:hypothetical protein
MSDWYGNSRSNYFRVKDIEKFKVFCARWGVEFIAKSDKPELIGFLGRSEYGGLPSYLTEEAQDGEMRELDSDDFYKELAEQLKDGEVAVLVESGAQKLAYISGISIAVNSKGETLSVDINDIYEKAKTLGENITKAEQ